MQHFEELAKEVRADARGSWCWNEEERCGYLSLRDFGYQLITLNTAPLSEFQEKGQEVFGYSDEQDVIAWDGVDELFAPEKEPIVYVMWERQRGTICVDYKNQEIYADECGESDYPYYTLVYPDGTTEGLDAPE